MTWDAVIAGASFGGLAAAQRLRGRVLLLDRSPLGAGQTSACAAPVGIVRAMGAEGAILQVHNALVLHTPRRETVWPLPEPFCTFDYAGFCRQAFARTGAVFRQSAVLRRHGRTVLTRDGAVSGRLLIDATGWRAALAGRVVRRRLRAFGIETELTTPFPPGLHFYFLPEVRDGYAWAFPCRETVRFGVLSYLGRTRLAGGLTAFLARFGLRPGALHGGYLASGLTAPVVDEVFVVGDAAGQCLPLTGEGIRTAVLAGWKAGQLLQEVLDGTSSIAAAARAYEAFTGAARGTFRALTWANAALLLLPLRLTGAAAAVLSRPGLLAGFMRRYLGVFAGPPPTLR